MTAPVSVADRVITSLLSISVSSVGVTVKLAVPEAALALMVSVTEEGAVKSTTLAAPEPAMPTVRLVFSSKRVVPCIAPVTVIGVAPANSATVAGLADSVTSGAASLSVMVMVVEGFAPRSQLAPSDSVMMMVSPSSSYTSSLMVKVMVL